MLPFKKKQCLGFVFFALVLLFVQVTSYGEDIFSLDLFESSSESNETDVKEPRIRFFVYSNPRNLSQNQELLIDHINETTFLPNVTTKILIHGFLASCNKQYFPQDIIKAYLRKNREQNIICVDWSSLANPPVKIPLIKPFFYRESVLSTIYVGEKTSDLLAHLAEKKLIGNMSEVHVIGLSLGAHIAGITGFNLKDKHKLKLGRITGLDPAGIFFKGGRKPLSHKLDYKDAEFVDIIHTNMGRLGLAEKIGHADFYPNGGKTQPSCYQEVDFIGNLREQVSGQCSHLISAVYFKDSISRGIKACKADSWEDFLIADRNGGPCETAVAFGENCSTSIRGKYYLHLE